MFEDDSNRSDKFMMALCISLVGHVVLFTGISLLPSPSQFSIQPALSSIEVAVVYQVTSPKITSKEKQPIKKPQEEITELPKELVKDSARTMPDFDLVMADKSNQQEIVLSPKAKVYKTEKKEPKSDTAQVIEYESVPTIASVPVKGAKIQARPMDDDNPSPIYPKVARRNGWEGLVSLKVHVKDDGRPSSVEVENSSGYQVLDNVALKTVKEWNFTAARSGLLKVPSWIRIPIQFSLTD